MIRWKSSSAQLPTMSDRAAGIVTFALPDESRLFVRTVTSGASTLHRGKAPMLPTHVGNYGEKYLAIVHTGVGDTPGGRQRLQEMLASADSAAWVISAGYAGGLSPDLHVGDLVLGRNHSDPGLLNAARLLLENEKPHVGTLVTRDTAAETAADKGALHAATGALAVDMETAWIADVCAGAGVPMLSVRVISDAAGQGFPVPGRVLFDAARQRPRYLALPLWLLAHPSRVAPFAAFVRGLSPARVRLTRALSRLAAHL